MSSDNTIGWAEPNKHVPLTARISDRFLVERLLGEGTFGAVYRAFDELLDRHVAIKLLKYSATEQPEIVSRFQREATILAQLSENPHVLSIHDIGTTGDGFPYLVTEFVSGGTLSKYVEPQEDWNSRTWVLEIASQVLVALADVHERGVVHRDLKPANICLSKTVAIPHLVKVIDFGLSWSADLRQEGTETALGTALGTPWYMSPEVLSGDPAVPASDLYALGLIVHQLAYYEYPFDVTSNRDVLTAHLVREPNPPPERASIFPEDFRVLLRQMLSKDPEARPPARECLRRILRVNSEIVNSKSA